MKRIFFALHILLFFFPAFLPAKVWINEFMQSNIDLVRDDLQEFPDSWIELYNDSDEEVNIQNWTISIGLNYQNGWKIKDTVIISPKSHLLIYCDEASTGLHTNFRLDSGSGGTIYLFNENGIQIDVVRSIPKQPAPNISRGRVTDGNILWSYFVTATPGGKNTGRTSNTLLPSPVFSQSGGIFKDSVNLGFSLPNEVPKSVILSDIHYTIDNSEPTINSPAYTGNLDIFETTVIRAKLIHPDYLTNISTVNTYIISEKEFSLPVISISTDSTYLWDEEFGIYCEGNGEYGLIGNCLDYPLNWNNNWRRPINFEYFPLGSKTSVLNQLCEMRISGGCSRTNPQKSLIVYGNKRFGTKRFEYDLFSEKPNQEIKSFMIRNSGNDFWSTFFRDAAVQLFMGGKVNIDYQAYQPAIFYLNGKYWGIQNLRERSEEDFILANYATENVDVVKNWWGELKAGDLTAWNQLMNELRKPSSQRNYQWIISQIDIDEYINYMILEIYVSNIDFPGNNMIMWRPRLTNGKWRFILKDLDFSLGFSEYNSVTHNALEYNTENDNDDRKLFNALLTQDSFRKEFYSRFAIYMGDILHYKSTSQIIDSIQFLLEPDMPDHLTRWVNENWIRDINTWKKEVQAIKTWCEERNVEVYRHLRDYFELGTIMQLRFETANNLDVTPTVSINGVHIRDSGLEASYFQNETLELHYDGDTTLYAWVITQTINETTAVKTYCKQDLSYQIADGCSSVNITLRDKTNSFKKNTLSEINLSVFDNQLHISDMLLPSDILIYDISGKLVTKTSSSDWSIVIPFNKKGIFIVKVQNKTQLLIEKVVVM